VENIPFHSWGEFLRGALTVAKDSMLDDSTVGSSPFWRDDRFNLNRPKRNSLVPPPMEQYAWPLPLFDEDLGKNGESGLCLSGCSAVN